MPLEKVLFVDIGPLFAVLFWGNVISLLFLITYRGQNKFSQGKEALNFLVAARLCHAFYYFVALGRGALPNLLSVNIGNAMLLVGYYFEALALLQIIKVARTRFTDNLLLTALIASLALFGAFELYVGTSGARVTAASLGVVALMTLPVAHMLFSDDSNVFTKSVGLFYCVFLMQLLLRAWCGMHDQDFDILSPNALNSLTFLSLLLQHIIALPAYALIMKGHVDEALLLMATTDRLTGATNRHAFLDAASAIHKNCAVFRIPWAILFIDIDRFKLINDRYGHAFGDVVLIRLASLIDKCLRVNDLSCRYGGEEFVLLLSRANAAAAQSVAERILDEVRRTRFEEQPAFSFSISIGVSSGIPSGDKKFEAYVRVADEAMYEAKRTGRDRIVLREI